MKNNINFSELPDNIKAFINSIINQDYASIHRDGWTEISVTWEKEKDGQFSVRIPEEEIGFKFTAEGVFAGIWNWKE